MKEEKTILRFYFEPIEDEDSGTDIFVRMNMPTDANEWNNRMNELDDCISSYIDSVPAYTFDELALDVAQSFDPNAEIVRIPTIHI